MRRLPETQTNAVVRAAGAVERTRLRLAFQNDPTGTGELHRAMNVGDDGGAGGIVEGIDPDLSEGPGLHPTILRDGLRRGSGEDGQTQMPARATGTAMARGTHIHPRHRVQAVADRTFVDNPTVDARAD